LELIKELVEKDKAVLNEKLPDDSRPIGEEVSPLYFVQRENRQPLFSKYMLDAGADPNVAYGDTTLLMCANGAGDSLGDSAFLKMLIEHDADIDRKDETGYTALDYATENLLVDNMQYLVDKGALVTGNTIEIVAGAEIVDERNYRAAKIIFMAAEKQGVDYDSYRALGLAALGKTDELIAECEAKGDAYAPMIPFYAAAYCGQDAIEYFKNQGFDMTQHDDADNSLLYVAASAGNLEVVKYLVEDGASVDFTDADSKQKCNT
jgi:ankyrin repeat protein